MPQIEVTFKDPNYFWKNFRLGTELHIAGSYLYDGLLAFDRMEHFCYEDECFEFLYRTSVGLERLEKIVIILLEHNSTLVQEDFEKSLITHNHMQLLARIQEKHQLTLGKQHNKFLQLISEFYISTRYSRYNRSSVYLPNQDKFRLVDFIEQELGIDLNSKSWFPTGNDNRIKRFVGKIIGKITIQLYKLVKKLSYENKLATYEIRYDSKAFKIFIAEEFTFEKERVSQKEILTYLLNNNDTDDGFFKFLKSIKPINLDDYSNNMLVKYLFDFTKNHSIKEGIEYQYEENEFDKERFSNISTIGSDADFDTFEEDDVF